MHPGEAFASQGFAKKSGQVVPDRLRSHADIQVGLPKKGRAVWCQERAEQVLCQAIFSLPQGLPVSNWVVGRGSIDGSGSGIFSP